MRTELLDYDLPEAAIAQRPTERRQSARMLEVGPELVDRLVSDFAELVPRGSMVVLNDTRVRRARLRGKRVPGGGRVEIFLLHPVDGIATEWAALGRANKALRPGVVVEVDELRVEVLARDEEGTLRVRVLGAGDTSEAVEAAIERVGRVPLPPYVKRPDDAQDEERYQTVFAQHLGSVAAPTAGLHLTQDAIERLVARGVQVRSVTLHVGVGTFRPVMADDLNQHPMHAEEICVSEALCTAVQDTRAAGGKVIAVGTTVVRALESAAQSGELRPYQGSTRLLIQPGYAFRVVDGLLTNFHMPRSTLLALVSAFSGHERLMSAYACALERGYRFLSYGDAMWIPARS